MRRNASAPRAMGLGAILLMTVAGTEAQAQAQFRHDGNGRIIAMSNLSPTTDCFPEIATGTIAERHIENGVVRGLTFRADRSDDIYLNVPELFNFASAATKAKVAEGYETLLGQNHMLRVGFKVCGAAGRIKKLDAISLVGARSAPAAPVVAGGAGEDVLTRAPGGTAPDDTLLRSPGAASQPGVAAAQTPTASPPPQPTPAPAPAEAPEDRDGWTVASDERSTRLGVVSGMHYNTIQLDCVHRTRLVEVIVDDDKGRYRAGSRQSFSLSAGIATISSQGRTSYNEMDEVRQIHASIPLEALRPVLEEMARGNPLTIITRARRLPLKRTAEDAPTASTFLAACSGRR